MVKTYGLTHVAVAVADLDRASDFYKNVFGSVVVYRSAEMVQLQTPGSRDVLVFEKRPEAAGTRGGIIHFGFRLTRPEDIEEAIISVEHAGGIIRSHGEFCSGEPFLFASDPDGYEIEIWFERPTPVDPV